jgi:hypothetical protein
LGPGEGSYLVLGKGSNISLPYTFVLESEGAAFLPDFPTGWCFYFLYPTFILGAQR